MKKKIAVPVVFVAIIILGFLTFFFFLRGDDTTSLDPIVNDPTANRRTAEENLLILVNKDNKLPDDYQVDLAQLDKVKVAKVLINDLVAMRDAAAEEGISLSVNSAYRSTTEQQQVWDDTVADHMKQGSSRAAAEEKTAATVAQPGYSEHETGLAIDFALKSGADEGDMRTWIWLDKNAHKYGFIHRYPDDKVAITGINWEPWHYRYVGREDARAMFEKGLVLEEYLQLAQSSQNSEALLTNRPARR